MKAVFLDRDGTIIVDPPDERVDSASKITLFPDTIEALRLLARLDYGVFLITNQAGIAEGRISKKDFGLINHAVLQELAPSGVHIIRTYVCPHSPADNCGCRKPHPTLLLQAAREFNIDLVHSWMVGDRQSDVMAGVNAGTKTILVKTANIPATVPEATYTAPHLLDAIHYIETN